MHESKDDLYQRWHTLSQECWKWTGVGLHGVLVVAIVWDLCDWPLLLCLTECQMPLTWIPWGGSQCEWTRWLVVSGDPLSWSRLRHLSTQSSIINNLLVQSSQNKWVTCPDLDPEVSDSDFFALIQKSMCKIPLVSLCLQRGSDNQEPSSSGGRMI